jgi:hypothetical protein
MQRGAKSSQTLPIAPLIPTPAICTGYDRTHRWWATTRLSPPYPANCVTHGGFSHPAALAQGVDEVDLTYDRGDGR